MKHGLFAKRASARRVLLALVAMAIPCLPWPASSQARKAATWFEGARLIVGDTRPTIEQSAFLVEGDSFTWVGRKGERLSALQHLVNLMLSRRMGEWTRVLVDVEDYRGRRERQLGEIARRAAERVRETGTMLQLEPMPALERRWVHIALRDVDGVATQSIGEEPQRRVVVIKT